MMSKRIFNPDDYLQTPEGRVFTNERSAAAWEQLYAEMEQRFAAADRDTRFFLVMGVQGGGKTSWVRANHQALGASAVFMDAALPAKRHRARALAMAKRYGISTVAVWINTPLQEALARNARRPSDEVVPESAVRSVFGLLEPPTIDEGFDEVIVVSTGP